MFDIISNTPLYVWPLLGFLLVVGLRSTKTHVVSWNTILIMPVAMVIWSVYANIPTLLWIVSAAIGCWFGLLTIAKLNVRFDKNNKLIEIEGNLWPLALSMIIFSLRYLTGVLYGMHPYLKGSVGLLMVESVAAVVSGMFIGRLLGYYRRSKISPHVDLTA